MAPKTWPPSGPWHNRTGGHGHAQPSRSLPTSLPAIN
eukprot:CAMPEP_0119093110 /NCGR_PEP_ID=MMETSP1178-20130426/162065_1 /TAXON_ID=33656 /ORGANISM="unid sp, Strain CCMP2000" /LENGTH=36 /DNA_ID= /DNA_START= /DNA_END= /DNA_ORIENTATION=